METEPSPDEENVAADTHDRHVFVRFVSMFCNKNAAAFKEASISLGAQLKSVDKGAGVLRTSQAEVMVGLEAIFLVDSTDDVVQLSITPQLGEKAWTGAIPLAGLYARRNEIMVDIGDKRGSAKVVLKCYGFGKQVPVADTSILPMPALPDVCPLLFPPWSASRMFPDQHNKCVALFETTNMVMLSLPTRRKPTKAALQPTSRMHSVVSCSSPYQVRLN